MEFPETSQSLIARIKDLADEAAWSEFLAIYRPVIYRMALRRGLQEADAQDVTQRVCVAITQAIHQWQPDPLRPPFRAWLVTITRNAVTKVLARPRIDQGTGSSSVMELLHSEPEGESSTSDEFSLESRREALRFASEQIRPEFSETIWHLFWQTAIEGKSITQIMAEQGCTAGAVYMARFRVSRRLKEKVLEISHHWNM